ncbi:uncharacterized protein PV07_04709 [Cladophialophora immunda]|uniref:Uncharacterized protein n=1 Tax=Cladophialophora immunda TaxID=569365 RepID=A0A0D1ZLK3_9EURO|nr:uncharacterized protein PV07_04709 [Cladophialophora immunda]KIW28846.1 hypothetical protein PV07_04709 [Cladophialophora immunda]
MAYQSRYHIAAVRNRRLWKQKLAQNDGAGYLGGKEPRARKERYDLPKNGQLVAGDSQENHNITQDIRLHDVKALLNLQSEQLLKLAVCENCGLEPAGEKERIVQEQAWKEILCPTEEILKTIHNQLR